jgi:hypothetical protein
MILSVNCLSIWDYSPRKYMGLNKILRLYTKRIGVINMDRVSGLSRGKVKKGRRGPAGGGGIKEESGS